MPADSPQVPAVVVVDTKVVPAGSGSETVTLDATEGPWLVALSV